MIMKKEIVTLGKEHFEMLEDTARKIWYESYSELLGSAQIEYMLNKFLSVKAFEQQMKEDYIYRGLFIDGKLAGFAGSQKQGERIFLSKLYLEKKYHHLGLGGELMSDTIALYPECNKIYLTVNKHNRSFDIYRHLGIEVIDSVVTDIGNGYVMDDYIMQRTL